MQKKMEVEANLPKDTRRRFRRIIMSGKRKMVIKEEE
jgi:hypothetical protein